MASSLDMRVALAAGWSHDDIEWEIKMDRAAACAFEGQHDEAGPLWVEALDLARTAFKPEDPRLGTSLANCAYANRLADKETAATAQFEEALRVWSGYWLWVMNMPIERRARSSLFHLRMEALHRDKYEATARERLRRFGEETHKALVDLSAGKPPPKRGFERWRAEKPAIFGETRKMLAACLLLVSLPS